MAVDEERGVWSWGRGEWGRLGEATHTPHPPASQPERPISPALHPAVSCVGAPRRAGFGDSSDVLEPQRMDEMCGALSPTVARVGEAHSACVGAHSPPGQEQPRHPGPRPDASTLAFGG
jgi:hypothetical protein